MFRFICRPDHNNIKFYLTAESIVTRFFGILLNGLYGNILSPNPNKITWSFCSLFLDYCYVNYPFTLADVSLFCLSEKPRYVPGPSVNIVGDLRTVTQSSEYLPRFPADLAIDGDSNTFSHTNTEPNAWWSMDFCNDVIIARVRLWNRSDCCDHQMTNFVVTVDNDICGRVDGAIGVGKSIDVTCPKPLVGKVLKIQRTDNSILSISELHLFSSIKTCWESREATNSFGLDCWQRSLWAYSRRTYRKPVSKRLNRNE